MNVSKRTCAGHEGQSACGANQGAEVVEIHNVRPILEKPMSWLRLIHTTPSGLRLLARTEDDEIVEWIVHDPSGRPVPTVMYQKQGAKKECRICVKVRGETQWWEVPCDKIVILPVVGGDESGGVIEVHDIRPVLKDLRLSEGLNRVFTTPSGLQF